MAKKINLQSQASRAKLVLKNPHWETLAKGVAIGYRRLSKDKPGRWLSRRTGADGKYIKETVGIADDFLQANGETVLSHFQAVQKISAQEIAQVTGGMTVAQAAVDYLRSIQHKKDYSGIKADIQNYILPGLGDIEVNGLTKTRIEQWFHDLLKATPRRGKTDPERAAKVTANKKLSYLKALLNHAYDDDENKIESDRAWKKVKAFPSKEVGMGRIHRFTAGDLRLIINTCEGGFRDLVIGASKLGTRPGAEIANIDVGHFDEDLAEVHIVDGKTGARDVTLDAEGVEFFKRLSAGRNKREPMFVCDVTPRLATHEVSREDLYSMVWERPIVAVAADLQLSDQGLRKACQRRNIPVPGRGYWRKLETGQKVERAPLPKEDPSTAQGALRWRYQDYNPLWRAALERVGLDTDATFYALRHTYASLNLLAGAVPQIVADNMGTSLEMLEKYYAKFMRNDRREMFESTAPKIDIGESSVVNLADRREKSA